MKKFLEQHAPPICVRNCFRISSIKRNTLMNYIDDHANHVDYTLKTIDLGGRVPNIDSIEFLRIERPYWQGYRYGPFVRVRYAPNGVEQINGFPMDVDKGIFLHVYDDELAEQLRTIAPKIIEILQEDAARNRNQN